VKHEIRYNKHSACHDRRFERGPMKGARSQRRSLFVCAGIQSGGDVRRWCGSILCHSHHHSSQCVQACGRSLFPIASGCRAVSSWAWRR